MRDIERRCKAADRRSYAAGGIRGGIQRGGRHIRASIKLRAA